MVTFTALHNRFHTKAEHYYENEYSRKKAHADELLAEIYVKRIIEHNG